MSIEKKPVRSQYMDFLLGDLIIGPDNIFFVVSRVDNEIYCFSLSQTKTMDLYNSENLYSDEILIRRNGKIVKVK